MTGKKNGAAVLKWLPLIALAGVSAAAWGANMATTSKNSDNIKINDTLIKGLLESRGELKATYKSIDKNQTEIKKDIRAILRQLQGGGRPVR